MVLAVVGRGHALCHVCVWSCAHVHVLSNACRELQSLLLSPPSYPAWSEGGSSLSYQTEALPSYQSEALPSSPDFTDSPTNPLLHNLLSHVERPTNLPFQQQQQHDLMFPPSPWSPLAGPPASSSPPTPSYSLFSPSAWPPPSLLSPQASPHRPLGPLATPSSLAQPSPLERLLHQAKEK